MSRRFQFYRKKRGDRATGSEQLGRLGEALFYAAALAVGGGALSIIVLTMIIPQWRASYIYRETTCRVVKVLSPEENRTEEATLYRPRIRIAYTVAGRAFDTIAYDRLRTWFADRQRVERLSGEFKTGRQYPCWYDPDHPEQAVLVHGTVWWVWLLALLPAAFVVFGIGGLARTLLQSQTSRERRAALALRAGGLELFEPQHGTGPRLPSVPHDADLKNSPGTTLAYRLPIATIPSWKLFATVMTCLCWNVLVALLVVTAIRRHLHGHPDWFLTVLCLPFVVVGLWLCYYLLRRILMTTGIGATRIEISDHPLLPGREYELLLSQAGNLSISALEVSLVCDEQAIFRQGTNSVMDTRRVCRQQILRHEGLRIQPGIPYEVRCRFSVPATAMHSFKSNYNAVNWKLVVKGDSVRWPDHERNFPVIVHPKVGDAVEPRPDAVASPPRAESPGEGSL